ncbi:nicotinamide mononucleotide transporter [Streptococcus sp. DD12]|uniref:nicotinamide mononucleotide transporter n=1 Tax=Streptococcus sp. DD12 TaxID=1777880 RepID=UPI0007988E87|nr:nicotinamide mononucleotide transporter [Streptococcus sp. DD12]KXT75446.1 hypothetical protein STRDD12_01257 [Streptococcus sp. DD12]
MLHKLAQSKWFDLLGVAIVVGIALASGYLTETLADVVNWGPWTVFVPFGLISIGNSVLSIMSTRLTGRMSNVGNIVGIINVVLSGTIDYLLGNKAAIITYPVTFIIYTFAINKWMKTEKYEASRPLTGAKGLATMIAIFAGALIFSFATNYIGYAGQINLLFWVTTLAFGLSMGANVLNAMKLTMQWRFWFLYNLVQLVKALVQGNWANVGKYIYYIINSIAALSFWTKPKETEPLAEL